MEPSAGGAHSPESYARRLAESLKDQSGYVVAYRSGRCRSCERDVVGVKKVYSASGHVRLIAILFITFVGLLLYPVMMWDQWMEPYQCPDCGKALS